MKQLAKKRRFAGTTAKKKDKKARKLNKYVLGLETALRDIIKEAGKVDISNWPAQQQICQNIARKALKGE